MRQSSKLLLAGLFLVFGACGTESGQSDPLRSDSNPKEPERASGQLEQYRERGRSDDAETIEEAFFHGQARALVIQKIEPNKLGIGGAEFRVKRNPVGQGAFVYDPRTRFAGVERNLVWFVPDETRAYALNGPSKMVTPGLLWPREDGIDVPPTHLVVAYVFEDEPLSEPSATVASSESTEDTFTVAEYRIYRAIIDTPMSVSEAEAVRRAARANGVSEGEAKGTVDKVERALFKNKWIGSPSSEIRHASDWSGEEP